jgi:hypothetical protein
VAADELTSWLGSMGRYSGAAQGEKGKWCSFYRAQRLLHDRGRKDKETTYVKHAAVSICGGVPPRTLRKLIVGDDMDNGVAARLLIAMPPRRSKKPSRAEISQPLRHRITHIYSRLLALELVEGDPVQISVAQDAWAMQDAFIAKHGIEQMSMEDELSSAWSKLEAAAFRLGLIFAMVRWAEGGQRVTEMPVVTKQDLTRAFELIDWFCHEWQRFYGTFTESPEQLEQRKLIEWIANKGGVVSVRELNRGPIKYRGTSAKAEQALRALVKAGICRSRLDDHTGGRGRPCELFELVL